VIPNLDTKVLYHTSNRTVWPFLDVFAGNCEKVILVLPCPSVCITLPCHWIVMKFGMGKLYYLMEKMKG
jgi:hypothetical protein